jgi:hypothetical protein
MPTTCFKIFIFNNFKFIVNVKISLRFLSWLDILVIKPCPIPYILFKLEEIKRMRPYLRVSILYRCLAANELSFFSLLTIKF